MGFRQIKSRCHRPLGRGSLTHPRCSGGKEMMTPDGSDKLRLSLPPPSLSSVRVKKQSFVDTPRRGISRFQRLLFCRSASAPRVELRVLVGRSEEHTSE